MEALLSIDYTDIARCFEIMHPRPPFEWKITTAHILTKSPISDRGVSLANADT